MGTHPYRHRTVHRCRRRHPEDSTMRQLVRHLLSATTVLATLGACTKSSATGDASARVDAVLPSAAPAVVGRDLAVAGRLASGAIAEEVKQSPANATVPGF